jgi:hypothetical protein
MDHTPFEASYLDERDALALFRILMVSREDPEYSTVLLALAL